MFQRPKERKVYSEESLDDDEIEGKRTFNIQSKLTCDRYSCKLVQDVKGSGKRPIIQAGLLQKTQAHVVFFYLELNMRFMQENGFTIPLLAKDKTGLGMR